jgi:NAD(P)H-dependent FMN reductase
MKLGIVIGSVREGRVSDRLAKWVEKQANSMDDVEAKIIDLKDYPMALFDEPVSPQYNPDRHPEKNVKAWIDAVGDCDAIVLVTPEYNRSYSAVLKNALDYLDFQIKHKPVMLVAHGSTGGAQAVSHLRAVVPGLGAVTSPISVMVVGQVGSMIDEKGNISEEVKKNPYGPQASLENALADLKWLSDALSPARAKE